MATDADSHLEIAHVLFIDIVGYSKKLVNEQTALVNRLNELVRQSAQCRSAEATDKLIKIATGDGMALVFFTTPDAPVLCAIELSRADQQDPKIELRMGIHSGPVDRLADVNDRANVTGAGINMAQRVMDCGDAGHILLSKRAADDLAQYAEWSSRLHDLGEVEIKHGARIAIANLSFDGIGNPALPGKLAARAKKRRTILWLAATLSVLLVGASASWLLLKRAQAPPPSAAENAPIIPEKSIAVLPFENMSENKEDAFFADGIQDDVLTSLGKIKELTVIGRNSVMGYRGAAVAGKLREIGQALGVAHLLQGSVRRAANRVVVNVQLIDTRDEHQLWSERYERTINDALSLQSEVAVEIARELRATLSPAEKKLAAAKPTENPEAYLLYLRAREIETSPDEEPATAAAIKLYREAIAQDPKFALARARLSFRITFGNDSAPDAQRKEALAQAEESLRLNPNLGEGRIALAAYRLWCQHELEPALAELVHAEELLPNSSEIWRMRAIIYKRQDKFRERIAALQRGEILEPRELDNLWLLQRTFYDLRQWPEALRTNDRIKALSASDPYYVDASRAYIEFRLTGVLNPLKRMVAQLPAGAPASMNTVRYELAMLERDCPAAERSLRNLPATEIPHLVAGVPSKPMLEGLLAVARGADATAVESALVAARKVTEKDLVDHPDGIDLYGILGLIDAFRGRKEDAIREGRSWLEAKHFSVMETNAAAANLALIYARTGETHEAIKLIEKLLTLPADLSQPFPLFTITQADLKWRWVWDPLRSDPRFQKILEGPEPKTVY